MKNGEKKEKCQKKETGKINGKSRREMAIIFVITLRIIIK